jgi:hypothetical protein
MCRMENNLLRLVHSTMETMSYRQRIRRERRQDKSLSPRTGFRSDLLRRGAKVEGSQKRQLGDRPIPGEDSLVDRPPTPVIEPAMEGTERFPRLPLVEF